MPIEMPKGLPFSVDTWTPQSRSKRHHFLTHAHKDHLAGIASHFSYPIYATKLTKSLVLRNFQQVEEKVFVEIEVGETVVVKDPDGDFTVMAFDANHCPGAVMFLFEGEFGNVLHTGDCRLTPECIQHLPMKYITKKGKENLCHLDYLFLDCTFGRCFLQIPSKQSAIQQVINCIWKHPNAPVIYLACDMLGQEDILVQISQTFGSKIYVEETNNSECFHVLSLLAPEILSQDAASRFQVIEGFPRLNDRASRKLAEARASLQPGPLFIRPSTQWYANHDQIETTQVEKPGLLEAVRDEIGIWHVCYSMHSPREELEWALNLLQPKWVISTTPPCRAMELDYVKKHCYKTRITNDDPLWKLLRVDYRKPASPQSSNPTGASAVSLADHIKLKLDLPPLSDTGSITLFGRARLGLSDTDLLQEKFSENTSDVNNEPKEGSLEEELVEGVDIKRDMHMVSEQILETAEVEVIAEENEVCRIESCTKLVEERDVEKNACMAPVQSLRTVTGGGSLTRTSVSLGDSLRRVYRSMNVPVPRPLPSLVEQMGAGKRRVRLGSKSVSPSRLNYCYNYLYHTSS